MISQRIGIRPWVHIVINLLKVACSVFAGCTIAVIFANILCVAENSDCVGAMAALFSIPAVLIYYFRYKREDFDEVFKISSQSAKGSIWFLAFGMCLNIAFISIFSLFPESFAHEYSAYANSSFVSNIWLSSIYIALISPIFEEIIFRGAMMFELKKVLSTKLTILLQAVVFSSMHENLVQIIYTFIFGALLGWIGDKHKNILAPIIVHIGFNIIGVLIFVFK